MDVSASSWLIIVASILAANMPFINERLFSAIPVKTWLVKPLWCRLLELVVLYFVIGALSFLLESRAGNRFVQTWEFYSITACLFIVLAFPGFVYRYLRKQHG